MQRVRLQGIHGSSSRHRKCIQFLQYLLISPWIRLPSWAAPVFIASFFSDPYYSWHLACPISHTTDLTSIFDALLWYDVCNLRVSLVAIPVDLFQPLIVLLTKPSSILASSGRDFAVALERPTGHLKRVA
jgi:hypothetical protein